MLYKKGRRYKRQTAAQPNASPPNPLPPPFHQTPGLLPPILRKTGSLTTAATKKTHFEHPLEKPSPTANTSLGLPSTPMNMNPGLSLKLLQAPATPGLSSFSSYVNNSTTTTDDDPSTTTVLQNLVNETKLADRSLSLARFSLGSSTNSLRLSEFGATNGSNGGNVNDNMPEGDGGNGDDDDDDDDDDNGNGNDDEEIVDVNLGRQRNRIISKDDDNLSSLPLVYVHRDTTTAEDELIARALTDPFDRTDLDKF